MTAPLDEGAVIERMTKKDGKMKRVKQIIATTVIMMLVLPMFPKTELFGIAAKEQASTYEELWDNVNDAYIISSVRDLKLFRDSLHSGIDYKGKTIYLNKDIHIEENDDTGSVGGTGEANKSTPFEGTFHGRGHSIEGWNKKEEALFLKIGESGMVSNLTMKQVKITHAKLGTAIAFQNSGTIKECTVSGSIDGEDNNYASFCYSNTGLITNCVSSADISTSKEKASIAGIAYSGNNGMVSNSIYYGKMKGTASQSISMYGITNGKIDNCYYLGKSGYHKGGKACTEEMMKIQSTFEGLDFKNIWNIEEDGYPYIGRKFMDLQSMVRVPVDIQVQVGDYTFGKKSAMGSCYFPLSARLVYGGKDESVKNEFEKICQDYDVAATLRESRWKKDFMVNVPVDGVAQDFSKKNIADYFDFSYTQNEKYEFYVNSWNFTSKTGTYYDNKKMNRILTLREKENRIKNAERAEHKILDLIYEKYGAKSMENAWFVFTCARADYFPKGTDKDKMFRRISDAWHTYKTYQNSVGKLPETTETSKFLLAVTALGFDATDVSGDNLITELRKSDQNGKYFAVHYMVYALYSGRYGDYESYVKSLVKEQMKTSKASSYNADDMATMYMQPIFLLYDKNASVRDKETYAIKEYVEKEVIPWLKHSITGFGTFYSPYTKCSANVWTDAQAQMLLAWLKADFLSEGFIKNGNTILDYITSNPDLSMGYTGDESQCARAIVSLIRCYHGQNSLFDCSDVTGVREVEVMIKSLPKKISENDTALVRRVQKAYSSLTNGQKSQVDNYNVLEKALNRLDALNRQRKDPVEPSKKPKKKDSVKSSEKPDSKIEDKKQKNQAQNRDLPDKNLKCKNEDSVIHSISKEKNTKTIRKKTGLEKQIASSKKDRDNEKQKILPAKVLGESSLVLNGEQSENEHNRNLPYTVWMYTGILGTGIFILTVGLRMKGKLLKKAEEEQHHEPGHEETTRQ